jgi:hypothetical protein
MKLAILSVMLIAAPFATAQKNAPSKAECQADAIAWSVTPDGIQALQDGPMSTTEIDARAMVLLSCTLAYTPLQESNYSVLSEVYERASHVRLIHFLKRHPEIQAKFIQDDAAGMR